MTPSDDNVLVLRVKEGDVESFRQLVERHQDRIYYLGIKFLRNREEAQDFAQEVFLKAFSKLSTFRGEVPFFAWLYRIAFNLAVNVFHVRRREWERTEPGAMDDGDNMGPARENTEVDFMREETRRMVNEIVGELPPVYGVVIKLHYYDGLKYEEISEMMKIPVSTIKSHIFRAKKIIRKKFDVKA